MRSKLEKLLIELWYDKKHPCLYFLLTPFSFFFRIIVFFRKLAYQLGFFKSYSFKVPVIVVGNISVGGTGKTPFVIKLAQILQGLGYHPGLVSRGFGGKKKYHPQEVLKDSIVTEVGDEALLLKRKTQCPVFVCKHRVKAIKSLIEKNICDIIICDDGLQHYQLQRDIEILMIDANRGMGNQCVLPRGPLREPLSRLKSPSFIIHNGESIIDSYHCKIKPLALVSLKTTEEKNIHFFKNNKVHAVAGIGHPERFFQTLTDLGIDVICHSYPDHYHFQLADFIFEDDLPIVMTEKDAVKCDAFADHRFWFLKTTLDISPQFEKHFLKHLHSTERKKYDKKNHPHLPFYHRDNDNASSHFCNEEKGK